MLSRQGWGGACAGTLRVLLASAIFVTSLAHTPLATAATERRFQMALFDSDDSNYSDVGWLVPDQDQPLAPRRSVFFIPPPALVTDDPAGGWVEKYDDVPESQWPQIDQQVRTSAALLLQLTPHDWTRIDAVMLDEPFLGAAQDVGSSAPCSSASDPGYRRMRTMQRVLVNVAAVVRDLPNADKVRIWVNFSEPEMQWMMSGLCPVRLNDWYMDVVSLDIYGQEFATIEHYYDYLFADRATAYQQLALVPGTYSQPDTQYTASAVANRLQGFFDYADSMNHSCSLVTGRVGVTKSADGCPVWLVAGFWGEAIIRDGRAAIFHPNSAPILNKWLAQFQLPHWDGLLGRVEVFDIPSGAISGWAVDRTLPDPPPAVDVWLFSLDTQNPTPPIYLGGTEPTQQRSDVEAGTGISLAGYTFTIPVEYRQVTGCHEYTVYAVARPPGVGNAVLGSKKVQCP